MPVRAHRLAHEIVQLNPFRLGGLGSASPLEHQQVVHQPSQARRVVAQIGQYLRLGSVAQGVLDVAAQRRDRRPKLMRSIGQEATFNRGQLDRLLNLGKVGIDAISAAQREALGPTWPLR